LVSLLIPLGPIPNSLASRYLGFTLSGDTPVSSTAEQLSRIYTAISDRHFAFIKKSDMAKIMQPVKKKRYRQLCWYTLSILITVSLMAYLINTIKWSEFFDLLARVSLLSLLASAAAYLILNYFRAIRFRTLLEKGDTPMRVLFPITLYHNFLLRVLPFKLGELSYIILLHSHLNFTFQKGVSTLFSARILELLIILVVFAFGLIFSGKILAEQREFLLGVVVVIFAGSVSMLYFAGSLIRTLNRLLQKIASLSLRRNSPFIKTLYLKLTDAGREFDRIRQPKLFFFALFISLFTFSSIVITYFILLRAVGLDSELPDVITIISICMFLSAFPLSVSGFGVVEISWVFGLTQVTNCSISEATSIGFMLHGFQVTVASVYGLLGYLAIKVSNSH
jgi:uncharacterized membrane protein YbhN (UPF0104 family)